MYLTRYLLIIYLNLDENPIYMIKVKLMHYQVSGKFLALLQNLKLRNINQIARLQTINVNV